MKRIEDDDTPPYALTTEELACLTQGIALGLLANPLSFTPQSAPGILVRFRAAAQARRVKAYIA